MPFDLAPNGITPGAMMGGYHALIGRSATDIRVSLTRKRPRVFLRCKTVVIDPNRRFATINWRIAKVILA